VRNEKKVKESDLAKAIEKKNAEIENLHKNIEDLK